MKNRCVPDYIVKKSNLSQHIDLLLPETSGEFQKFMQSNTSQKVNHSLSTICHENNTIGELREDNISKLTSNTNGGPKDIPCAESMDFSLKIYLAY